MRLGNRWALVVLVHWIANSYVMIRYILRRCLIGLLTVWAVTVLAFVIIQAPPGDFISSYLAQLESGGTVASEAEAAQLRELWGLNDPVPVQYAKWMGQ